MINKDRIVPVTATDLISLYSVILLQASGNSGLAVLAANDVEGNFTVKTNNGVLLADQPVKVLDIDATASSVSACTVFFVADYAYEGITVNGAAATVTGIVDADGRTLHKAVLSSGAVTITKVGF